MLSDVFDRDLAFKWLKEAIRSSGVLHQRFLSTDDNLANINKCKFVQYCEIKDSCQTETMKIYPPPPPNLYLPEDFRLHSTQTEIR